MFPVIIQAVLLFCKFIQLTFPFLYSNIFICPDILPYLYEKIFPTELIQSYLFFFLGIFDKSVFIVSKIISPSLSNNCEYI